MLFTEIQNGTAATDLKTTLVIVFLETNPSF